MLPGRAVQFGRQLLQRRLNGVLSDLEGNGLRKKNLQDKRNIEIFMEPILVLLVLIVVPCSIHRVTLGRGA